LQPNKLLCLVVPEANSNGPYCVTQVSRQGGVLVAGGDEEDVWAWNDGKKWGNEPPIENNDD
jgi:hypothetical protein